MAVISFSREASKDEMGREIDRRGAVIDALTEERDRLKQWQADQVEVIDEAKALITELNADKKALEAERDRLAKQVDELQELFRIDGENHASVIRDLTNRHETRITKYAERIKELRDANAELLADQRETLKAVLYHFGPEGAQKVTTHTLEQRKARALLDKHKATSTEPESK